jgi:hypothetical protein
LPKQRRQLLDERLECRGLISGLLSRRACDRLTLVDLALEFSHRPAVPRTAARQIDAIAVLSKLQQDAPVALRQHACRDLL